MVDFHFMKLIFLAMWHLVDSYFYWQHFITLLISIVPDGSQLLIFMGSLGYCSLITFKISFSLGVKMCLLCLGVCVCIWTHTHTGAHHGDQRTSWKSHFFPIHKLELMRSHSGASVLRCWVILTAFLVF